MTAIAGMSRSELRGLEDMVECGYLRGRRAQGERRNSREKIVRKADQYMRVGNIARLCGNVQLGKFGGGSLHCARNGRFKGGNPGEEHEVIFLQLPYS